MCMQDRCLNTRVNRYLVDSRWCSSINCQCYYIFLVAAFLDHYLFLSLGPGLTQVSEKIKDAVKLFGGHRLGEDGNLGLAWRHSQSCQSQDLWGPFSLVIALAHGRDN